MKKLKQLWKETDVIQKILAVLLLPFGIVGAILYGLWLVFWNWYGVAFLCAMILMQSNESAEDSVQRGQAAALLIAIILLIIRAYKKNKDGKNS